MLFPCVAQELIENAKKVQKSALPQIFGLFFRLNNKSPKIFSQES